MKHIRALAIKFVMITAVLLITLGLFYGVDFGEILTISLILTVGAYLLGDLLILSQFGNTAATIADFGIAYFGTWLIGAMIIDEPIRLGVASFLSAAGIAIGEAFFHRYVESNVINKNENESRHQQFNTKPAFQTEFAEESYPEVNAGYNQNATKNSENSSKTNTNKETYTTEFGEETDVNTDVKAYKKSNNQYYRSSSSSDTEFGEETFTVAGTKDSNGNQNNSSKKQNYSSYQTEFGEEYFPMSASTFFGEANQEKFNGSPNVTNDPSYYVNAANNTTTSSQQNLVAANTESQATNQTTASEEDTDSTSVNSDDDSGFLSK